MTRKTVTQRVKETCWFNSLQRLLAMKLKLKDIKYFTLFISALFIQPVFSQSTVNESDWTQVLLPSPTSTELSVNRNINNAMSTGSVSMQIPLFQYKTKSLNVPIELSYSTRGFKVDDISSRVGHGWSLTAGGVISRTINGKEDGASNFSMSTNLTALSGAELRNAVDAYATGALEGEPDIYNFNFLNYQGRFLVINGSILKIDDNNLNIIKKNNGFEVKTPDGNIFTFDREESSQVLNDGSMTGKRVVVNSWYLSEISSLNGDIIYFKYGNCSFTYYQSKSQFFTYKITPSSACATCPNLPVMNENKVLVKNNGVYLTEISSNRRNAVLKFKYLPREDLVGDFSLFSIEQFDGVGSKIADPIFVNPTRLKGLFFSYTIASTANGSAHPSLKTRYFLTNVNSLEEPGYTFVYSDLLGLPERLSNSQDYYGFYNGRLNATLIPRPNDFALANQFQQYGFGDRRSDSNYSKKGLLTKVIYPTGGFDSLVYEGNTVAAQMNCDEQEVNASVSANGQSSFKKTTAAYSTLFAVSCNQKVTVNFGAVSTTTAYPPANYKVSICLAGDLDVLDPTLLDELASVGMDGSATVEIDLPPGEHRLALKILGPTAGWATMFYKDYPAGMYNQEVGGVRLKSKISFDGIKQEKINYLYQDTLTGFSTAQLFNNLYRFFGQRNNYSKCADLGTNLTFCSYGTLNSWDNQGLTDMSGNHLVYQKVYESKGENFENGGVEHNYILSNDGFSAIIAGNNVPQSPMVNYGTLNGLERFRKTFRRVNGKSIVQKEEIFSYKLIDNTTSARSFYAVRKDPGYLTMSSYMNLSDFKGINIAMYTLLTRWNYVDSIKINLFNDLGDITSSSLTVNNYSNDNYKMLRNKSSNTSGLSQIKVSYLYPFDSSLPVYQAMVADNIYEMPINEVIKKGQIKIAETNYEFYNPIGKVYVPQRFEKLDLTNQVFYPVYQFLNYNSSGRLLEIIEKNSTATVYLWGYGGQYPIVEIKNSTYADVVAVLTQPVIDNLNLTTHTEATMETLIKNAADKLRSDTRLAKAMVTSYTYKPLVGMTSKTDARGITEYYKYDGMQRLQAILDHLNYVTKTIDYHYKSAN